MKIRVAVVMGGHTSEYEISLKSGAVVMAHLDQKKIRSLCRSSHQQRLVCSGKRSLATH